MPKRSVLCGDGVSPGQQGRRECVVVMVVIVRLEVGFVGCDETSRCSKTNGVLIWKFAS